jgi:phosphate transport system protein
MQEHISKQFDQDLSALHVGVSHMANLTTSQIERGIRGLAGVESPVVFDVQSVEAEINTFEIKLNKKLFELIARRQPAAVDLRLIMAYARAVNDLERIGDEAKKIAVKSLNIAPRAEFDEIRRQSLVVMLEQANVLVNHSITALLSLELHGVTDMVKDDEEIDQGYLNILKKLIELKLNEPVMVESTLEIALIAKAIERIGDHAKNIVEGVVHVVKGEDVRHAIPAG